MNDRGGGFGGHNTTTSNALGSGGGALLSECTIRVENRFEIRVDTWGKKNAFSTNNNDNILHQIPTFYFLTHMHQDHLRGLREDTFENDNNGRIYCTEITKILLVKRFPRLESKVKVLEFNVYCLDAGHCPGSAMFVFEGTFGKVLHTGDFRREDWSGSLPSGKRMSLPTPGSNGSGSNNGLRKNFF
ncbi:unnamed protein product [Bathycoccus prasinos]